MTNPQKKKQEPSGGAIPDAQVALRRYRDLVEGIDHGIVWEADVQLRFHLVSKRAERMLGYPLDQWYSEPDFWRKHLHPDDRDLVLSLFQRAVQGKDQAVDHRFMAADGRVVWFHTGIHAAFDEETPVYRGLSVEITRLKETEEKLRQKTKEAEEANQAKSYFLSVASHEIRNAMNAVLGYSDLLIKELVKEDQRKGTYYRIHRNAKDLIELVNRILDVDKIEAGEMHLQAHIMDLSLSELLRQIIEDLSVIWEEKGLAVKLIDDSAVPIVQSDRGKLRQIFTNLIMNAIKFTDTDSVTVRINHFCEEKRYCVDVEDTGIGIDAKELPQLFKPYYQAGLSGSRPGVGLGLAIVKKLVDFLNGTIEVKSQPGKGSTFTVSFPYDLPQT